MKNTIKSFFAIIAFLCLFQSMLFSQETRRPKVVGISVLPVFSLSGSQTGGAIYCSLGKFVGKKTVLGGRPYFGFIRNYSAQAQSFGIDIYTRHYFRQKKFGIFIDGSTGVGKVRYSSEIASVNTHLRENNGTMLTFAGGLGIKHSVSSNIDIEFITQYLLMHEITPNFLSKAIIPTIGFSNRF